VIVQVGIEPGAKKDVVLFHDDGSEVIVIKSYSHYFLNIILGKTLDGLFYSDRFKGKKI
jgi:hypothetical protein